MDVRVAEQKASAKKQSAKGTVPSSARQLPPGGPGTDRGTPGRESLSTSTSGKGGFQESFDEMVADLEDEDLEGTDAALPATGAGSGIGGRSASPSKGKAAAAPKAGTHRMPVVAQ